MPTLPIVQAGSAIGRNAIWLPADQLLCRTPDGALTYLTVLVYLLSGRLTKQLNLSLKWITTTTSIPLRQWPSPMNILMHRGFYCRYWKEPRHEQPQTEHPASTAHCPSRTRCAVFASFKIWFHRNHDQPARRRSCQKRASSHVVCHSLIADDWQTGINIHVRLQRR